MADVQETTARPAGGINITPVGGVRQSSATDLSGGVDGQYTCIQFDANGNLRVTGGGSSSQVVQGTAPSNTTAVGNPVWIAGWDGVKAQGVLTDTSGHIAITTALTMSAGDLVANTFIPMVGIYLTDAATLQGYRWYTGSSPAVFMGGRALVSTGLPAFTSLNAVTAVGAGTPKTLNYAPQNIGVQITTTGSPTTISVTLQGSLDGTNWFNIGAAITAVGLTFFAASPCTSYRLNLGTLTGGTSPTVTGIFCAN